jgi:predicted metal-dependent enzyme (double-stranded beta helix superfamily)
VTAALTQALTRATNDAEFAAAMERFACRFLEYRDRLPAIPRAYSRTRLLLTPRFEIVAMNWTAGAVSPIHDHGASRCWVLMLEGTLEVENFARDVTPRSVHASERLTLRQGDLDHRLGPTELHRVANPAAQSAFSLQLYAAPIATYSIFDPKTYQERIVPAICDLEIEPG